jgi:hypothetical protein
MAEAKKDDIKKRQLTTSVFRASHPHVFKPTVMQGGQADSAAYSIEMLFSKKTTDLKPMQLALHRAAVAKWGPDKNEWPEGLARPISDGDKPKLNKKTRKKEVKPEHKGNWVVRANLKAQYGKVVVTDADNNPIENEGDFYPGCYARAALTAKAYEFGDKFGVRFELDGVQFVRDGEPLGSKRSADDMFGAPLEDDDADDEFSSGEEEADEESEDDAGF